MKKFLILLSIALAIICAVFIAFSPSMLSVIIVVVMMLVMATGHIIGIRPNFQFSEGFRNGRASIESMKKIASDNKWAALRQLKPFFKQKTLDDFFELYLQKSQNQQDSGLVVSDIEDIINEDSLELRNWRGVVLQVAGVLTALGLLGTFLGLMTGISSVSFTTVEATITSIEQLLEGIATAFYTSIVGVILSVLFNISNRVVWNITLREMNLFMEQFHAEILPYAEEQTRINEYLQNEETLRLLSQINNAEIRQNGTLMQDASYEQRMMVQVLAGVENGEFSTVFEPVCKLEDRSVVKAVGRLRWTHASLGVIDESVYSPVIAANGYLLKLEQMLWRDVAAHMSELKKSGQRTVPAVLYASKVFLMGADIPALIDALIEEFDLTPRDFEISLPLEAYIACVSEAQKVEQTLLKKGYRVVIHGYDGNLIDLPETSAEEIVLDADKADPEQLGDLLTLLTKK
ncbi:MAG: EAL domain-containing protein, partial [Clostridia bacterium]|nr:EAL domain-containing protein [Clostridia bacterium]